VGDVTLAFNDVLLQKIGTALAAVRPETFQVYTRQSPITFNNPPVAPIVLPDGTQIDYSFNGIAGGPPSVTFAPDGARIDISFSLSLYFNTAPPQTFVWAADLLALAQWTRLTAGFALQLASATFNPQLPDPWNAVFGIVIPAFLNPIISKSLVVPLTIPTPLPGVSYSTQQVAFTDSTLAITATI